MLGTESFAGPELLWKSKSDTEIHREDTEEHGEGNVIGKGAKLIAKVYSVVRFLRVTPCLLCGSLCSSSLSHTIQNPSDIQDISTTRQPNKLDLLDKSTIPPALA